MARCWVRFVDLHSVQAEPVDELDQLQRLAGRPSQLATQLGLSPAAEKALRHDARIEAAHARWLRMVDAEVVQTAASADVAPTPETTNGAAK